MRRSRLVGVSLIAVAVSSAAMADDYRDCLGHKDAAVRIVGCSALIQRNPGDALAHYNRGLAYAAKDDLDRAVADYTQVIKLNPNYGPAFEGRGRVYARKGDYTRAIADVTRASELSPKGVPKEKVLAQTSLETQPPPKSPLTAKADMQQTPVAKTIPSGSTLIEAVPGGSWPAWALRGSGQH